MFDKLFSIVGSASKLSTIVEDVARLLEHLGENYIKDQNLRDAAIDSLVQILLVHKSNAPKS